ncbi:MAG TPA: Vms1/Ankzf1 family peptidyl-tRNA hydrolase [Vicinamibacterales bacterium]|nr:Vms1/Ankzf1 family peptidyl-tRNA hydrolase [Vicinamibacterales bacterium]
MPTQDHVQEQLERLASFEPDGTPVVSLYLNTQADQHGRDNHDVFLKKTFRERLRAFDQPGRDSLERDVARIEAYVGRELSASANGLAIFSSSGRDLFEAIALAAPIDEHWLYINDVPQLYPLARVHSQYPRYAAMVADTAAVRIFVFATGELVDSREVKGVKTRGRSLGGWSQNRYQRRVDNMHAALVREAVEVLDRVVRAENIPSVILAGDEVVIALIRAELPKALAERVVEDIRLPAVAAVHDVLAATSEALARHNESTDRVKVEAALGGYRGGGLGVVGVEGTLDALEKGQVDELLIAASLGHIAVKGGDGAAQTPADASIERGGAQVEDENSAKVADELVRKATQTSARITFIEDGSLLAPYGGVGALLRFRI